MILIILPVLNLKEYLDLVLIYSFCFWLLIYFFYILAYISPKILVSAQKILDSSVLLKKIR